MTYEEFKKFIDDNNIISRKVLQEKYAYKYKLFCKFSDKEKEILLPIQKQGKYNNLVTAKDFQEFIDMHQIKSNSEFYKIFPGLYNRCRSILSLEDRLSLKYKTITNNDWSSINKLQDFQNFINMNNIKTNKDFVNKYPGLYKKYCKLFSKDQRLLKFPIKKEEKQFSKLADFQKYIDDNKIRTYKEFRKFHKGKYSKYLKERTNWNNDKLVFPLETKNSFTNLITNEDFQNYIDENGINTREEFRNTRSLSSRFYRVVPRDKRNLVFKNESRHYYYDQFSTLDDFQAFIDENNILRPIDFRINFPKLYDRFSRIISSNEKQKLQYGIDKNSKSSRKSYGERYLMKLLNDNDIDFISEKTFPELKGEVYPLRYDLYLPKYNILLEYHGEQHFNKDTLYYSETLIENDKKKYDFANKNGIQILYFTLHKSSLKKFGYFTEVITDANILIQKIKDIGLTTQ